MSLNIRKIRKKNKQTTNKEPTYIYHSVMYVQTSPLVVLSTENTKISIKKLYESKR